MLTRGEQSDVPDIDAQAAQQQARIAALGITISQFQKTIQGSAMIERQELFVLNGRLYQGYNQKAVEVPEDQCTPAELEKIHDVDGSLVRVMDTRQRRLEGSSNAKDREMAERKQKKIAAERDQLELQDLKHRIADREASKPPVEPPIYACAKCSATFEDARALNMHKVGAKH